MSNSPTVTTSTTSSSHNCHSPAEASEAAEVAVIACGALGAHVREIVTRRGWPVELHLLPSALHNRPGKIKPHAERLARSAQARGLRVALAYADCGTYGGMDELCGQLGVRRLPGLH